MDGQEVTKAFAGSNNYGRKRNILPFFSKSCFIQANNRKRARDSFDKAKDNYGLCLQKLSNLLRANTCF